MVFPVTAQRNVRRRTDVDDETVHPGLATGKFELAAQLIAETVPPPEAPNEEAAYGRYLARTIFAECHGAALRGDSNPDCSKPDLRAVAAYSPDAFAQLLRTVVAIGERNVGMMSAQALNNLSSLTDAEIAPLYSYLHSLPEDAHNRIGAREVGSDGMESFRSHGELARVPAHMCMR